MCFVLPAIAIVLAMAWAYVRYGSTPTGGGVLSGVGPVVIALVAVAAWELARGALGAAPRARLATTARS